MGRALIAALVAGHACVALNAWAQTCQVCGEIRAIREVSGSPIAPKTSSSVGTQSGLDTAPVVGTVAQFHFGGGKSEGWSFGAAGTPEMQARLGETYYEITVAMDSGDKRTVERKDGNRFYVGQRVALRSGELEPMQP
jgi:outer membrane lipoprotein SlyB